MAKNLEVDICVIGGGSGGLSVAAGASQMGASTVLIEKAKMGGDCLNTGCVPSKAMLAAAHAAQAHRHSGPFGVGAAEPKIDGKGVYGHIHSVIAAIAPNDSVERFEGLGVKVIQEHGRFTGPGEVEAGDTRISARRFVIATGSSPFVPPIKGLDGIDYFTNESIFEPKDLPSHLIVIGGGPIGLLIGLVCLQKGARVILSEVNETRRQLAGDLGMTAVNPTSQDLPGIVDELTGGAMADCVFEVSGSTPGVAMMTELPNVRGRIVMVAIHPEPRPVNLFKFFWSELRLIGVRLYEEEDFDEAIRLATCGALALDQLITEVRSIDAVQQTFELIDSSPNGIKYLIDCRANA